MRPTLRGLAAAAALAVLALATVSCQEKGYCLDCDDAAGTGGPRDGGDRDGADGDGGNDAAPIDAAPGDPDACASAGGSEVCNGLDDDCDGQIDEGTLPEVGDECGTDTGPCQKGTTACVDGELVCAGGAINPTPETCDNADNDCDGVTDDGNPGGGLSCGSPVGECQTGVTRCNLTTHTIVCDGEVGVATETCNGRDDDCDGTVDDGTSTLADCGPVTETGLCQFGELTCVGGQQQCVGAVFPQVEDCDLLQTSDRDCNGNPTNGFNLQSDAHNCGACGDVCQTAHAFEGCASGDCYIAACETDYWNVNGTYNDGCEYGPCDFQGAEDCNQDDDDCDKIIDEDLDPPDICQDAGACAGTSAACETGGWDCNYGANVSKDGNGDIVPETTCDGIDNDCDGDIDEPFALLGLPCDDGEQGVCKDSGVYVCAPGGVGVECSADDDDTGSGSETCDGLDNDCDGTVDDGDLNAWVDVGSYEIFAYEASRPDARANTAGVSEVRVCSKANALPWTGITHDAAQTECAALGGGARLCTEAEWESACETTQTFNQPSSVIIREAEAFTTKTNPCTDAWSSATAVAGFSGTGYMVVGPDGGDAYNTYDGNGNCNGSNNAVNRGAALNYTISFPTTGTWYVWIRATAPNGNGNTIHAGIDGVATSNSDELGNFPTGSSWVWLNHDADDNLERVSVNVASTGNHSFNLFMREDGIRVDRIILTSDATFVPGNPGPDASLSCTWAYDENCRTYQGSTCNGNDYDTDSGTAGDQDDLLATGALAACFADWAGAGHVFDMSGNVKEWTAQRAAAVNPIRGGSYNNSGSGLACGFDFLTADDAYSFENVGFRCCR